MPVRRAVREAWKLSRDYAASRLRAGSVGWEPRTFVAFIGYPRSGHSIIGALLDAHPRALIAHELDVLQYVYWGFGRDQIFYLLRRRSESYARDPGLRGGYGYSVPPPEAGRAGPTRVIGDKHGEATTLRLRSDPALLERLRDTVGVPVRLIHVVRNPYDNISTIREKTRRGGRSLDLEESVAYYLSLCDTVTAVRERWDGDWFEVRHETFVRSPRESLTRLCGFLDLDPDPAYLDRVVPLVFQSPRQSRRDAPWTPELVETVRQRVARIPYLGEYTFDD